MAGERPKNETDVADDDAQVGPPDEDRVGRDQGVDVGYAGETGAERRAQEAAD